jgi:hypothetical protein
VSEVGNRQGDRQRKSEVGAHSEGRHWVDRAREIRSAKDLYVYKKAYKIAMDIFQQNANKSKQW